MQDGHKEAGNRVAEEGKGLSEEDESKINEVVENVDGGGDTGILDPQPTLRSQQQQQQPPPPGPIIRWERFLPVKSLKVLLVENDDSTRQVVSALLRNCSYEVIAAANGLQAWNILEDSTNHVDLVLTEVVMPCLSGVGLLSKIMGHKTCNNMPVIMMSSNDSMATVFKCLSKGAADFLVKPIRKNELKNLWQHVWKRRHSSCGSGSECGVQDHKSKRSKSADDSDKNTGSNDEDEDGSIGLNARDGNDNGSGTQSSWTKRVVEIESPQPLSPADQLTDLHDSACAQVIHPKPEKFCNPWMSMTTDKECEEQHRELDGDDFMGKDLEIGMPDPHAQLLSNNQNEKASTNQGGGSLGQLSEINQNNDQNEGGLELGRSNTSGESTNQVVDLIGGIANNTDKPLTVRVAENPNGISKMSQCGDKINEDSDDPPSIELSLKRLRSTKKETIRTHDDRIVLRRSYLSAFSRYSTSAASNQVPTGYGGSCSVPVENNLEIVRTESTHHIFSNSNAAPLKQGSNGSNNNNDMDSTTKNICTRLETNKEKIATTSTVNCTHPSVFNPVQCQISGIDSIEQVTQEKMDDAAAATQQSTANQGQVQVHHHHHHHHHHLHSLQQQQAPDHDDLSHKDTSATTPQCGSSNVFVRPMEGIAANYSINESASGSNHGSNGQNWSSTAVNTRVTNMENDNRITGKSGAGGSTGNESGSGSVLDSNRITQREAALNKFRQKRKERNFGKKVRYQTRKKLAEQRPRVRGQFARIVNGCTSQADN